MNSSIADIRMRLVMRFTVPNDKLYWYKCGLRFPSCNGCTSMERSSGWDYRLARQCEVMASPDLAVGGTDLETSAVNHMQWAGSDQEFREQPRSSIELLSGG